MVDLGDAMVMYPAMFVSMFLDTDGQFVVRIEGVHKGPFEGVGNSLESACKSVLDHAGIMI